MKKIMIAVKIPAYAWRPVMRFAKIAQALDIITLKSQNKTTPNSQSGIL